MTKRFFFSEATLNKSHVLHVLSFFFPMAGHSYDNHLDNHCHPTDGDDEQPPQCVQRPPNGHHLTFVTLTQHLEKEGMVATEGQGYGDGWGIASWRQARDTMGHSRGSRRVSSPR